MAQNDACLSQKTYLCEPILKQMDLKAQRIIDYIEKTGACSSGEIFEKSEIGVSYPTLKRILTKLKQDGYILASGKGKGTKYMLSPIYQVLKPMDVDFYFQKEIDERTIKERFDFTLINKTIAGNPLFTSDELTKLNELQSIFQRNIANLSSDAYKKEFERLAIDLSWKSSQIEGNTYSLLETEILFKDKETAAGKTKEEAIMLLNHKAALDFIMEHPENIMPLTISKIEALHSILVKDLAVERNVRSRRVGISGINYRPLDNEFQIKEALEVTCHLINSKENIFEKALLALVLISYIQPFMDGNKRTARIISNALLIYEKYCPLSFRTFDSIDYKKAMLLFYEQNNITAFKKIFINQFEFAVNTYF